MGNGELKEDRDLIEDLKEDYIRDLKNGIGAMPWWGLLDNTIDPIIRC